MRLVLVFLLLISSTAYALEVDEKLTLKIIKTSSSKKTILINRGIEDGLAKGDHAKFFVSVGVIARGVLIKGSPTRSVWSIYRVVNADFLRKDQVMKLKITPAVKITKDESRMLVEDDQSSQIANDPRDLGITLADGADDLDQFNLSNKTEVQFGDTTTSLVRKNKEIFGSIAYSSFTEQTKPDDNGQDYSQSVNSLALQLGGEWYFRDETKWYSRISFLTHFTMERKGIMGHKGTFLKEESSAFGFGANLYPFERPSKVYTLIQYLNFTTSLGSTKSTYARGNENNIATADDAVDGAVIKYGFGYGFKFFTPKGYGAKLHLAYQLKADDYGEDKFGDKWLTTASGLKIHMGMMYRF